MTSKNLSVLSYPRAFYNPAESSFTPLFRFLDDFDSYTRENEGHANSRPSHHGIRSFDPRFDVHETETAYELHGELPGIERENVEIEFTDQQTLVVRGRIERTYTTNTPPTGVLEAGKPTGAITEADGAKDAADTSVSHKAEEGNASKGADNPKATEKMRGNKLWVSERSIGRFSRTFSLPVQVDQDAVSASLNNGILSIVVPKAKKQGARRIAID
jgi:HSP20 family molecular chaperone IbpA